MRLWVDGTLVGWCGSAGQLRTRDAVDLHRVGNGLRVAVLRVIVVVEEGEEVIGGHVAVRRLTPQVWMDKFVSIRWSTASTLAVSFIIIFPTTLS